MDGKRRFSAQQQIRGAWPAQAPFKVLREHRRAPRKDFCDVCIIGAGAAGLTAAIFASTQARAARKHLRIVVLEGAPRIGAKILVSGGGRCNVTHCEVSERDYCGGPRPLIRNVLRAFGVADTLAWMRELGVELTLEPTGKYFPKSGKARDVLDALLARARLGGAELRTLWRVGEVNRTPGGAFIVRRQNDSVCLQTQRLVIATGGLALPKTGSDGAGFAWARAFGHTVHTPQPALVPLVLERHADIGGRFAEFTGLSFEVRLRLRDEQGRILAETIGPLLFTHFGISGPAALDLSRHVVQYRHDRGGGVAVVELGHPTLRSPEHAEQWLLWKARTHPKRTVAGILSELYPDRFAHQLASSLAARPISQITRSERAHLAKCLTQLPLRVIGDRGFAFAETTAGGVDLREIYTSSMESRLIPGLFFCGEVLNADGRIGGFNFQWAWATGYLAGLHAARGNP